MASMTIHFVLQNTHIFVKEFQITPLFVLNFREVI